MKKRGLLDFKDGDFVQFETEGGKVNLRPESIDFVYSYIEIPKVTEDGNIVSFSSEDADMWTVIVYNTTKHLIVQGSFNEVIKNLDVSWIDWDESKGSLIMPVQTGEQYPKYAFNMNKLISVRSEYDFGKSLYLEFENFELEVYYETLCERWCEDDMKNNDGNYAPQIIN